MKNEPIKEVNKEKIEISLSELAKKVKYAKATKEEELTFLEKL